MRLPITVLSAALLFTSACKDDKATTPEDTTTEEEDVFENDFGQWLSMDATPEGKPAIAYYDATKGALGYAVADLGDDGAVEWSHHPVDGYAGDDGLDPGDIGKYASMEIAPDGTIWIAYYNASVGGLYYAKCSDGTWETGLADAGSGSSPDAGLWASLALNDNGEPVIAHYDASKSQLRVARWNGSGFTGEVVDEGTDYTAADTGESDRPADVGRYARILIADGKEYIAYYDAANGDLKLAQSSGGGWSIDVVDADGDVGAWPSMAHDGSDLLIAYHDVGQQDLKVATGSSSFTFEVVDDGEHVGSDSEIVIGAGGAPEIIYFDGQENDMKWTRSSGSTWETPSTVTGAEGARGFHNETVMVGETRYVACYDYTARTVWFSVL